MKILRFKLIIPAMLIAIIAGFTVAPTIAGAFAGGDGSSGNPHQITTCAELQDMSTDLDGYFILNTDIDCNVSPYNSGTGFAPVGTSGARFVGHLDGNDNIISGFFQNQAASERGIFGYLGVGGTVDDLTMTGVNITGTSNIGAIAGQSQGIIDNVNISGSITGTYQTGGIVGYLNGGTISNSITDVTISGGQRSGGVIGASGSSATLTNVTSNGNVTGTGTYGGGIAGFFQSASATGLAANGDVTITGSYAGGAIGYLVTASSVTDSYATGTVTNTGTGPYTNTGGFLGASEYSTFSTSFATGDVVSDGGAVGGFAGVVASSTEGNDVYARGNATGTSSVGGLIGVLDGFSVPNTNTFANAYSTGTATGTSLVGGLVGTVGATNSSALFWDGDTSGTSVSAVGTEKSTEEMKTESTFTGWDFDDTWLINQDVNDGYPCLVDADSSCVEYVAPTTTTTTAAVAPETVLPNGGDLNGDGTEDALQDNVIVVLNGNTNLYVAFEYTDVCDVENIAIKKEADLGAQDSTYSFASGLFSFKLTACTQSAVTVSQYYWGLGSSASDFTARKYLSYNNTYVNLDGASLENKTIGGTNVVKLTYSLTDGGKYDNDQTVNGEIVDPAGLATLAGALPATGANPGSHVAYELMMIGFGFVLLVSRFIKRPLMQG